MTTDPLAAIRSAKAALDAAEAGFRAAVATTHTTRDQTGLTVDAIAEAAGITRPTVYAWAKETAVTRLATLIADCTATRLTDIIRQTFPDRVAPGVSAGRLASVTLPALDAARLTAELDARDIDWGWGSCV